MRVGQGSEISVRILDAVADVYPEHHGRGVLGIHLGVPAVRRARIQDPALAGEKLRKPFDGLEAVTIEVPLRVVAERCAAVVLGPPPLPRKALDRLRLPLGKLIGANQQRHTVLDTVHGTGWSAELTGRDLARAGRL